MTGTKFGCGIAQCGACTVHLDGDATRSCVLTLESIGDKSITTIEGISSTAIGRKVQASWLAGEVVQCGYCQSGQIMSATALLNASSASYGCADRRCDVREHLPLRHLRADQGGYSCSRCSSVTRPPARTCPADDCSKSQRWPAVGWRSALQMTSPAQAAATEDSADFAPDAFIRIDQAGTVTLVMPHTEVGQGIMKSSAMLIGEELEIGLNQIRVEPAPPDLARYMDPHLFDQATGGSMSTRSDWVRLREAAAAARTMLVDAAADGWAVDPATCRVERGVIHHDRSGRTVGYGAVAGAAARRPVPQRIALKSPAQFTLIGTSAKRLEHAIEGGRHYGVWHRHAASGMQIGTLAIEPTKGGKLIGWNETPKIEVHLIRSGEDPGGIGEAGTAAAAAAPALGNAIFAATGRRVRILPFGNTKLGRHDHDPNQSEDRAGECPGRVRPWHPVAPGSACGLLIANLYYAQPLTGLISASLGMSPQSNGLLVTPSTGGVRHRAACNRPARRSVREPAPGVDAGRGRGGLPLFSSVCCRSVSCSWG